MESGLLRPVSQGWKVHWQRTTESMGIKFSLQHFDPLWIPNPPEKKMNDPTKTIFLRSRKDEGAADEGKRKPLKSYEDFIQTYFRYGLCAESIPSKLKYDPDLLLANPQFANSIKAFFGSTQNVENMMTCLTHYIHVDVKRITRAHEDFVNRKLKWKSAQKKTLSNDSDLFLQERHRHIREDKLWNEFWSHIRQFMLPPGIRILRNFLIPRVASLLRHKELMPEGIESFKKKGLPRFAKNSDIDIWGRIEGSVELDRFLELMYEKYIGTSNENLTWVVDFLIARRDMIVEPIPRDEDYVIPTLMPINKIADWHWMANNSLYLWQKNPDKFLDFTEILKPPRQYRVKEVTSGKRRVNYDYTRVNKFEDLYEAFQPRTKFQADQKRRGEIKVKKTYSGEICDVIPRKYLAPASRKVLEIFRNGLSVVLVSYELCRMTIGKPYELPSRRTNTTSQLVSQHGSWPTRKRATNDTLQAASGSGIPKKRLKSEKPKREKGTKQNDISIVALQLNEMRQDLKTDADKRLELEKYRAITDRKRLEYDEKMREDRKKFEDRMSERENELKIEKKRLDAERAEIEEKWRKEQLRFEEQQAERQRQHEFTMNKTFFELTQQTEKRLSLPTSSCQMPLNTHKENNILSRKIMTLNASSDGKVQTKDKTFPGKSKLPNNGVVVKSVKNLPNRFDPDFIRVQNHPKTTKISKPLWDF